MSSRIARRSLLKLMGTAAGATLLSPLLSQLSRAQTAPVPRFVFFVEGNGYEPVTVLSPSTRVALDATLAAPIGTARHWPRRYRHTSVIETSGDLAGAIALQDLGALAGKTAVVLGLSSKITGGGHTAYHGALSSRRSSGERPTGITIDAWLATQPALQGCAFDVVRVGYIAQGNPRSLGFHTCALGPGVAAPIVRDPGQAFDMLFGGAADPAGYARAGRMLDFARTDVQRALAALPGNSTERVKLESYLAAVEESLGRRTRLEAALGGISAVPGRPPARFFEDIYPVLTTQAGHVAVALQGGLTRVAVVGIASGYEFDTVYDASHRARHDTHHRSETDAAARDYIHAQSRLQLSTMIELARTLDAIPEGAGTLLDHTVLVYIGDNGETHHALGDEFPVVLMGGAALGLRTGGRSLVYPGLDQMGLGHRQVSNLWNTLGHLAGADLNDFGGESLSLATRSAEGPLGELLG